MEVVQLPVVESNLFSFHMEFKATDVVSGERHFLEHMMLNSNTSYTKDELHRKISNLGNYGLFGACTNVEKIFFSGTFLKRDELQVWELLRTVLQEAIFDSEEIDKERKIIAQEYHQSKDELFRQMYASLGQMLNTTFDVLGSLKMMESISQSYLKKLYKNVIHTGNARLFISNGSVPEFALMRDDHGNSSVNCVVPKGQHFMVNSDMSASIALHTFDMRRDCQSAVLLDEYMSSVVGPLFQKIREEKQLCYMVGSMPDFAGDELVAPYFTTYVVSHDKIDEAKEALLEEFVVEDVKLFDSLRKAYELEIAQAKTGFRGWIKLHRRAKDIGIPINDFLHTIPTWDEFKKYSTEVRERHIGTFVVKGTKDK